MTEEWRDAEGYKGLYEVSSEGRVRSLPHYVNGRNGLKLKQGRILKERKDKRKYCRVCLSNGPYKKNVLVHKLVGLAFPEICGEWFEGAQINHKDENPSNNRATNLEWCTAIYNINYGTGKERSGIARRKREDKQLLRSDKEYMRSLKRKWYVEHKDYYKKGGRYYERNKQKINGSATCA